MSEMEKPLDGIAIVGMSGRFPGARNVDQFWDNLCNGVESIKFFTDEELLAAGVSPELLQHPNYVKAAPVLEGVEGFDASFFGMSLREAEIMDPQQRLFLECAWEALEHAGYDSETYPGAISVFGGSGLNRYVLFNIVKNEALIDTLGEYPFVLGNDKDFLALRVSYKMNLKGGSMTVQSACSTSLVSIHTACQSLLNGETDMAMAGGVTIAVPQVTGYVSQQGLTSSDGHCKAFDADASGTIFGSGVGVVVLKRLEDAMEDGDTIYAVIRGSAINNDGSTKVSFTAPSVEGQVGAIAEALAISDVSPESISYVETHGTATALGDLIEITALTQAFREGSQENGYCAIGSAKTNIGHLDTAAGVTAVIKTALSLKHKTLPPTLHYKRPNPKIDFPSTPFYVNAELSEWKTNGHPRRAGVSSFGFGGTNAYAVLEEAPQAEESDDSRDWKLLVLSAKTPTALEQATENLKAHLEQHPDENLADAAYTLQLGRRAFNHRRAVVCRTVEEAVQVLGQQDKSGWTGMYDTSQGVRPVVFLFSGEGSEYAGMAADLYESEPVFREHFDELADSLQRKLGYDLRGVTFASSEAGDGLKGSAHSAPALFAVEYALGQLLIEWGILPQAMIGHGVGEWVAASLAGVFAPEDALLAVAKQAQMAGEQAGSASQDDLRKMIDSFKRETPELPFLSGVTGTWVTAEEATDPAYWAAQLSGTPRLERLEDGVAELLQDAKRVLVEIGPGMTLSGFAKQKGGDETVVLPSMRGREEQRDDVAFLLDAVGRLWMNGAEVEWAQMYDGERRHRIPLPTYPFERVRCWIDPVQSEKPEGAAVALPQASALPEEVESLLYRLDWKAKPLASDTGAADASGRWLIFAEKGDVGRELGARLSALGGTPVFVQHGEEYRRIEDGVYQIRSANGDHLNQMLADAFPGGLADCRGVLYLWGLDAEIRQDDTAGSLDASEKVALGSALHLLQAVATREAEGLRVWLITRGAQSLPNAKHPLAVAQSPLWGMGQTFSIEHPDFWGGLIDLDPNGAAAEMARRVAEQVCAPDGEDRLLLRNNQRYAARLVRKPAAKDRGTYRFKLDGSYLITGGFGQLGLVVARWMAEQGARRLVLMGRTQLPPRSEWSTLDPDSRIGRIVREVREIEALGATVHPAAVDVNDAAALGSFVDLYQREWGPIRGVLHAAGLVEEVSLVDVDFEEMQRILQPKTVGAWNLHLQFQDRELDFFVLFSSVSSMLNLMRLTSYSAGNAFLDGVAQHRRALGLPGLAINWGPWAEIGMAATEEFTRVSSSAGMGNILPKHSLAALGHLLPESGQVGVAEVNWPRFYGSFPTEGNRNLLAALTESDAKAAKGNPSDKATGRKQHEFTVLSGEEREPYLQTYLGQQVSSLLNIPPDEIDLQQPFDSLGLDSLMAIGLKNRIETDLGAVVPIRSFLQGGNIEQMSKQVLTLMADLEAAPAAEPSAELVRRDGQEQIPLSFAQYRMWFSDQLTPNSTAYNLPVALRIQGELNVAAMEQSFSEIVRRHEALRTTFEMRDGQPCQIINPAQPITLAVVDLGDLTSDQQDQQVHATVREESQSPFNLSEGPLCRFRLLRLAEQEHVLIMNMHHIVFDHWSMGIFTQELAALYGAYVEGKPSPLEDLPLQYSDYAIWQRDKLQGPALAEQLAFWKRTLSGELPVLQLPTDRPRPAVQTYRGETKRLVLPQTLAERLKELSQREGATMFMTLLTGLNMLLHRYTDQEDLLIGTSVANRSAADIEQLIGMFVNMIVLRTDLSGDPTFRELIKRVQENAVEAFAHEDVPFEKLVEELQPKRDTSRSPLFQVMFTYLNVPPSDLQSSGLTLSQLDTDAGASKFDMTLIVMEKDDVMEANLEYNVDLFDAATIDQMLRHYQAILEAAVEAPHLRLSEMRAQQQIEAGGADEVLRRINDTETGYDLDQTLLDAFIAQAEAHPERVALSYEGLTMTYGELHERSNRIAHFLREQGVGRNQLVGILMERGLELMAGLYGIVKAGAAYVPIDPEYPSERIQYMLADSGAQVLLTKRAYIEQATEAADALDSLRTMLLLDEEAATDLPEQDSLQVFTAGDLLEQPMTNPSPINEPSDAAYMIYTSGSTGQPKGVLVPHRAIVNRLLWHQDTFQATEQDVVAQRTSMCFDVSVWELFWPLRHGATLSILPTDVVKDPQRMHEHLVRERVSVIHFVPSLFSTFVTGLQQMDASARMMPSLRYVITSGEALPDKPVHTWFDLFPDGAKIANLYGPTEAAIDVSCYLIEQKPERSVLIGKPIANTQLYVLDAEGRPCPVMVQGELHIGGVQLADGYHNKPDKTAEAFIENHLPNTPGQRLYRTGDLARFLPDGNIEYLGRKDSQVKVRGYRIELGEIENALIGHPAVENAAVLVQKGPDGNNMLVAFVATGETSPETGAIKSFLKQKMPEYMVPAILQTLPALPLSPNGKVDRKALAQQKVADSKAASRLETALPVSELQKRIASVWSEVLQREPIGLHDNFFDIGGHSLLVVTLRDRLKQELGLDIPMTDFFQYTTVKTLAERIGGDKEKDAPRVTEVRTAQQPLDRDVAIIGMSLRFPQAKTLDQFWENLRAGRESITHFAEEEMEPFLYNQIPANRDKLVRAGGFLEDIDRFDAGFFGMSDREAQLLDPQQRLFLQCAWEAIENAGYNIGAIRQPVSLYAGTGINQYLPVTAYGATMADMYQAFLANQPSFMATRVSYKLNLTGESMMVNTACSTSLVAVHMACESLLSGRSDFALAGAASIQVPQKTGYVYEPNFILSPDGHCRAFDKDASGTVTGNGVGVVFLKRLSDAVRDGDPIYAVIKGSAINNDGSEKIGYTAPSIQGQVKVIADAQAAAGVDPDTISYIETHGTGTKLGDPIEISALSQVFKQRTERKQYCAIGSVKTNIGHLDTAAGIAGLIKTALALKHGEIPKSLHFNEPNPAIDFDNSPFYVNTELKPWPSVNGVRRAGVSSFGIGGTNAHVILEEAPREWE